MPYSEGGEKCNLVTFYRLGEDTNQDYGRHRWLAQTFTLSAEHILFRFLVKSWTVEGGEFYHYALRNTDAEGKPIGGDIAHTTLSPTGELFRTPGKWRRFDFIAFPKLPAGTYALVLSVPGAVQTWGYKARADSTSPTYTLGKAWRSDDSGDTWSELEDTDLMFEVWGWQAPPEPPPTPVISNWAILDITFQDQVDGFTVTATTDIPCHLYMRWSATEPLTHPEAVYRRGLPLMTGTRFCFVAWHENEQAEAGDTLTHTFDKRNWPICQTRWFYFIGTKQAEEVPSASPIFSLHRSDLWIPVIIEPWTREYIPQPEYELAFREEWTT